MQNNNDDVMNYTSGQSANTEQFDKKSDNNTIMRMKCEEGIRPMFNHNGFVNQALELSSKYTHVMEFTKIRVIEAFFSLVRK